jgi:5-methylcytosine-specific restriction endonuclease McrA
MVRENGQKQHVLALMELAHRGRPISKSLEQRRAFRRRRRNQLRYRAPRFLNRTKPKGWLAQSLQHRVDTTKNLVNRLRSLVPVESISQELVRFDTQKMENPEVSGVEYQQGTLPGYEVREYLLEKWGRECAYCADTDTPLQIEHIDPKANGGSNRISNLTLACRPCNQEKGRQPLADFFASSKRLKNHQAKLDRILKQCKKPLRDAARKTGSFNIQTPGGAIQGISYRHCTLTQRADGYGYHIQPNQQKEEGDRKNGSR